MGNENLSGIFKKYLQGKCTPEEIAILDEWYALQDMNDDDSRLESDEQRNFLEVRMLERVRESIGAPALRKETMDEVPDGSRFTFHTFLKIAASIVFVSLFGLSGFLLYREGVMSFVSQSDKVDGRVKMVHLLNRTSSVMRRSLSDGTVVALQPNGIIEYPEIFADATREVHLTGEAFFDVAKDKNHPFIIATNEVNVKVLGTSFNVKAYEGAKEVTVAVRTGKVSVYSKKPVSRSASEVILTPNQEVTYNTIEENFSKGLVDEPQIIIEHPTLVEMKYDSIPVAKIFKSLEENYGIDIVYNARRLEACSLTTSLSEEGLLERIEIICQAIGAKYEIRDGVIFINAPGC